MKDRDILFHEKWLGLAQPIEGLVFSVPVLADAQIAPEVRPELSVSFEEHLEPGDEPRIRSLATFFRDFLGYMQPGMLVARAQLPAELSFYAAEGGQEIRPSFALGRGPFASDDLFAAFQEPAPAVAGHATSASPTTPWFALLWDLTESGGDLDLDEPEAVTGPWRYPPTAKIERLLRHVGIPIGILFNGRNLRVVYAPTGETTAHLTFRVEHLRRPDGRPLLAALDLLLHARRAYGASSPHTLEGLLAESRRRQADVTDELAKQVFEAIEILVTGFESAAARDIKIDRLDWLRGALEEEGDHFYQGVLSVILRLVFLLYAEDQSLLPIAHRTYAEHLSLLGLYQRLSHDAGAHPESMHHRFGAYGQLISLFRSIFFGVTHGRLELPPRRGRLFDPNAFPFLEGGLPGWTAAVVDSEARAAAQPPSVDDGTIYRVLHRLVVFEGQRLSYRTLDVEQIGSVYESLIGYHVLRAASAALRIGKYGIWVECDAFRRMSAEDRGRFLKETCGLNPGPGKSLEKALDEELDEAAVTEILSAHTQGRKADVLRHRAATGRLLLQPGDERRRSASHYTPRVLTEKVVRRTLEPLLACLGAERTAEQILQLKICDPAMGSGAFLVATCRYLASEIVAAWTWQGELARMIEHHGDAHLHARRLVAQRCLYGVDKDATAVELAKLSLWLITLSKRLPFTFVDHALRHGDSLVGLDFKQIEAFHWSRADRVELCGAVLREAFDQAVDLRQQILELAHRDDLASQNEKRRLLEFSLQSTDPVRIVADVCIGAFFAGEGDALREAERERRLSLLERWFHGDGEAGTEIDLLARDVRKRLTPFHWWIEFPEVFFDERPDPLLGGTISGAALMEAVVGNPPFMGGSRLTSAHGAVYSQWLGRAFAPAKGQTDFCAYFLRRAATLIGAHGALGLVATNSIGQGDTAASGLTVLLAQGYRIYGADRSLPWPGKANVIVSLIHLSRGAPSSRCTALLDGSAVDEINDRLEPKAARRTPVALKSNQGIAGLGVRIDGPGFLVPSDIAELPEHSEARNRGVLRPYLGGDDLNDLGWRRPREYVIDFRDHDEAKARASWPRLYKQALATVKAARESRGRRDPWWQFPIPKFYSSYGKPAHNVLAAAVYAKHLLWSLVPGHVCLNSKVFVAEGGSYQRFAVLQSRVHTSWAWANSSTLKLDLAYAARDAFQTFAFPLADKATSSNLDTVGRELHEARATLVSQTQRGLTKTYNAIAEPACDDPGILKQRHLHEALDRAVLDAYGWRDIAVPSYCPTSKSAAVAVERFEDEIIDRLHALNSQRASEESVTHTSKSLRSRVDDAPPRARPGPKKALRRGEKEGAERESSRKVRSS